MSNLGLSRALAQFVASTSFSHLDKTAVASTRMALLDGLGVSLAATSLGEGCDAFRAQALSQNTTEESRVWGSGRKTTAALAALANGSLAHALDFEDTHDGALVHPNAAVIPAALAVAEQLMSQGVVMSGEQLVTAIAVGCDVVCRLGLALTESIDHYGWYPPPILSAFGATAAAASLYKLNTQQVLDAFSLTLLQTSCSAEIKYNSDSVIRAVRDAFPAQTGVMSAQLAARGVKGFEQPFEGKAGFFTLFARGHYDAAPCLENLGERFEINSVSFKQWPSCRGTHVFIDMMLRVQDGGLGFSEEIARIETVGNGINRMLAEPLANKQQPTTSIDAKFSIPFCVAWTAIHGAPSLASFMPGTLVDKQVIALAKKISYRSDDKFANSGDGMLSGEMTIVTVAGKTITLSGVSAPGGPSRPLSPQELLAKFKQCCSFASHPMDESNIAKLANTIFHLDKSNDLDTDLFSYL